jgi:hypothetical protein
MSGPLSAYDNTTGISAMTVTSSIGSGSASSGWVLSCSLTADQVQRGSNYGNMIDAQRPWQVGHFPAPIQNFIENGGPFTQNSASSYITPPVMNWAAWANIIHGARVLAYFNQTAGSGPGASGDNFANSYYQTIQSGLGNKISIYDQAKVTNRLIKKMARAINAPFANCYASVSPGIAGGGSCSNGISTNGALPWQQSYTANSGSGSTVGSGNWNSELAPTTPGGGSGNFEVMAKWYTGNTFAPYITQNKFYLFAEYRGSGTDVNQTATFTLKTGTTTADRIYSDAVIAATQVSANVSVQVGDSDQVNAGDSCLVENVLGATGINGTFPVISTAGGSTPTITIGPATAGGAVSGLLGTITCTHNIPVTGGSFTDTWKTAPEIHIYRVN